MNHPDDLLAGYALGALDSADAAIVEEHVEECADCRAELAAYEPVRESLALSVDQVAPPPGLRSRALSAATRDGEAAGSGSPGAGRVSRRQGSLLRGPRWLYGVAAAFGALAIGLGAWNFALIQEMYRDQDVLAASQLAEMAEASDLQMIRFEGVAGGTLMATADGRRAYVSLLGLPPLPADRAYQIWIMDMEGGAESAGMLKPDARGVGSIWIDLPNGLPNVSLVGVTEEPVMGSDHPADEKLCIAEVQGPV